VPVVLNGLELESFETERALAEIRPEQIVFVKKRKTWILGSTFLEIVTK